MYCHTELIHQGDHDVEIAAREGIESNLHCPNCGAEVLVYMLEEI